MKTPSINKSVFFIGAHRGRFAVALLSYFILHTSYLLSGCQYTIDGNPDVNLITVQVSPISPTLDTGGTMILTASIQGWQQNGGVTWSIDGTGNGAIVSNGLTATYYAPAAPNSQIILRCTSSEDASRFAIVTISVVIPQNTIFDPSPQFANLLTSGSLQFTIDTLSRSGSFPQIKWSIVSGPGSISASGLYAAPASITKDNTTVFIKAASTTDPTNYSEAVINLLESSDSLKCFTRDIEPILSGSCGASACHGNGSASGGLDLETYAGTIGGVKPGDARGSRLYSAIIQLNANSRMPPPPQLALTPNQVLAIGQWINEGAQDCK